MIAVVCTAFRPRETDQLRPRPAGNPIARRTENNPTRLPTAITCATPSAASPACHRDQLRDRAGQTVNSYYLRDSVGTVTGLTDASGNRQASYYGGDFRSGNCTNRPLT